MSWHGQINRTIWEIQECIKKKPENLRYRRELVRAHFLQHFEFDRAFHVPRDDRSFLFLHDDPAPTCLLLHGAKGTPAEMRELGNYLYSKGYSVYCPRFSRTDTKERMVSWESWVTQAENALDTVKTYTNDAYIVGLSLGGTIGMILANLHGAKGLVVLAPALYPRMSLKARFYELGRIATPTLFYRLAGWSGEVLKAMDFAKRSSKKISVPVLALQASDDKRLSNRGLKFIRRHAGHPNSEIKILPHGSHVLTRGEAKGEVFNRIHGFLETL
jgi:esterase/lipase